MVVKMTDNSTDINILPEDKQAITDGANWLSQWITERYNQGFLEDVSYKEAMERLKNVKVVVADDTYEGLITALEKGEVHMIDYKMKAAANAHLNNHPELKDSGLTTEQLANANLKEVLATAKSPLGLYASFIEEPAIFLNTNKIKDKSEKSLYNSLTSATVHELTHNLQLGGQEFLVERALYGKFISQRMEERAEKVEAPTIVPEIKVFQTKKDVASPSKLKTEENPGVKLKEGEEYNYYLDSKQEVYARLMQLRYDFGLKPNESFTKEQIDEIEQRAKASVEKYKAGEKTDKSDIDFYIVSRYRNDVIQDMLNFTAEEKTEVKGAFKVQEWKSKRLVAQTEEDLKKQVPLEKTEEKTLDTSIMIKNSGRDFS